MQNQTILLADDEENDVFLMQRAFEKARLLNPLQVVSDGEQALDYLAGHGIYADRQTYPFPVILILDLKMPKRSGLEVLEEIRQQFEYQSLPIVVLTSSSEHPDLEKAFALGANSYLVKPADFESLIKLMVRLQGSWMILNVKV